MAFAEAAAILTANGSVSPVGVFVVLDSSGESVAVRHGGRSFMIAPGERARAAAFGERARAAASRLSIAGTHGKASSMQED